MNRLRTLSVLLAAALASGCSLIPDYLRPAAPVPTAFPKADAPRPGAPAADAIAWRDYFADARLREVIALALAHNRDLRIAALNIEKARAQHRIQRADLFPAVAATGSHSVQRLPGDLTVGGEAVINRQSSVSVGFSSYELDFFGRVRSLEAQALEGYLATEEARRSAQISLVAEVAGAWLALAADRERRDLARRTLQTREQSHNLIRKSHDLGAVSALDLRQSETLLEGARAELARYTALVARDENALVLLTGAAIPEAHLPDRLGDAAGMPADLPAGMPSEVLVRRPDILQAERILKAANASIGAARAAFFPSFALTAAGGTASDGLSGLFGGGSGTWSFLPLIRVPIFEAGRLQASIDTAEVQRDIHVAQYEKAIQGAFREVADALAERSTLAERVDARLRLRDATAAAYRLSEARYKGGVDSYLGLLDAQRTLYAAEQDLIGERLTAMLNRVTLYKVLGGGWK